MSDPILVGFPAQSHQPGFITEETMSVPEIKPGKIRPKIHHTVERSNFQQLVSRLEQGLYTFEMTVTSVIQIPCILFDESFSLEQVLSCVVEILIL